MPLKMYMNLNNNQLARVHYTNIYTNNNVAVSNNSNMFKLNGMNFKGSMLGRIAGARAGCSACGH